MRLRREPALLLISLLAPIVQMLVAFIFPAGGEAAGALNAAALAGTGLGTAALVRSDKLLPAITGFATALVAVGVAFGLNWTPEQQVLLLAPVSIIAGYVVRDRVVAPVPAEPVAVTR